MKEKNTDFVNDSIMNNDIIDPSDLIDWSQYPPDTDDYYYVGTAAKILDKNTAYVRKYLEIFKDYLGSDITTGSNGYRLITQNGILMLQKIIKIKDENNFKLEQLQQFLDSTGGQVVLMPTRTAAMQKMVEKIISETTTYYNKKTDEFYSNKISLLEQSNNTANELLAEYKESLKSINDKFNSEITSKELQIEELKKMLNTVLENQSKGENIKKGIFSKLFK